MGFSGNLEPQYIIPTVLATKAEEGGLAGSAAKRDGIEDLDFHVGDAAFDNSTSYQLNYPIKLYRNHQLILTSAEAPLPTCCLKKILKGWKWTYSNN